MDTIVAVGGLTGVLVIELLAVIFGTMMVRKALQRKPGRKSGLPEKKPVFPREAILKTNAVLLTTGLVILLTTGAASCSEREHRGTGEQEHQNTHESKIYGTVEKLPDGLIGTWVVKGRQVSVTKDTVIREKHGKAEIGAYVEVEGNLVDKTVNAYKIEVKKSK